MTKLKCGYCDQKAAKRYCSSLDKLICPICCGTNRLKNISCDASCRYLDNEAYQQRIREEKELKSLLENIPHSEHNDIFKNQDAAIIAYAFESFFADCYVKGFFNLSDQKVKETLSNLYYLNFKGKTIEPDEVTALTIQVYDRLKDNNEEVLIGRVILRIIISINNMTGGQFGAYGYLNFLKNNISPDAAINFKRYIIETKDGQKMVVQNSELKGKRK